MILVSLDMCVLQTKFKNFAFITQFVMKIYNDSIIITSYKD